MTSKTLSKARTIYKEGGVDRVAPTTYHVTSTSGETYVVELTLDRCTCPATGCALTRAPWSWRGPRGGKPGDATPPRRVIGPGLRFARGLGPNYVSGKPSI
ncbi:MAG: hypothetical protein ACR2GU_12330 [Rubrobacteraceae bacterium]